MTRVDHCHDLYVSELQELRSSEDQSLAAMLRAGLDQEKRADGVSGNLAGNVVDPVAAEA